MSLRYLSPILLYTRICRHYCIIHSARLSCFDLLLPAPRYSTPYTRHYAAALRSAPIYNNNLTEYILNI